MTSMKPVTVCLALYLRVYVNTRYFMYLFRCITLGLISYLSSSAKPIYLPDERARSVSQSFSHLSI